MQADGGTLVLSNGLFTNTGGLIQALNGSEVQLASGATLRMTDAWLLTTVLTRFSLARSPTVAVKLFPDGSARSRAARGGSSKARLPGRRRRHDVGGCQFRFARGSHLRSSLQQSRLSRGAINRRVTALLDSQEFRCHRSNPDSCESGYPEEGFSTGTGTRRKFRENANVRCAAKDETSGVAAASSRSATRAAAGSWSHENEAAATKRGRCPEHGIRAIRDATATVARGEKS